MALCSFNGERFLPAQLDSVLAQEDVEIEVIALDDGSSDDSLALLHKYASRDARIRVQRNPQNLGPTASFERAMALCHGDFIAPCDQDDLWHPRKLATLLAAIGHADLAYCDSDYIAADGSPLQRHVSDDMAMLSGASPIKFLFANSVSGHAALVRKSLLEIARPFPQHSFHDWWLALCAAGRDGIVFVPQSLVQFRRHGDAVSPMGKQRGSEYREPVANREWLESRQRLMDRYSGTGLRDHAVSALLAAAMRDAIDHGHRGRLFRLLWRHRRDLPRWKGIAAIDALKLMTRLSRKLRRASRSAIN